LQFYCKSKKSFQRRVWKLLKLKPSLGEILLPVLFGIGGIYIFFREWLESRSAKDEELEEDKNESKEDEEE